MRALAREMAEPWPRLQLEEGTFPDYLHGDRPPRSTRYGEAVLGYALMQTGLRENDDETLRQVAHCSRAIAAPDGDLAYFGRSQQQAWSPALTAYGALSAAAISRPAVAQRLRGLAARAIERLRGAHGTGPKGCFITPSLRPHYRGTRGLDSCAAAIGYSGLTLTALNWAMDRFGDAAPGAPGDAPPSRRAAYHFRTASPRNEFTVMRAGTVRPGHARTSSPGSLSMHSRLGRARPNGARILRWGGRSRASGHGGVAPPLAR